MYLGLQLTWSVQFDDYNKDIFLYMYNKSYLSTQLFEWVIASAESISRNVLQQNPSVEMCFVLYQQNPTCCISFKPLCWIFWFFWLFNSQQSSPKHVNYIQTCFSELNEDFVKIFQTLHCQTVDLNFLLFWVIECLSL